MAILDVQVIEGLALPYASGAESGLLDPALDPAFLAAWRGLLLTFPGLTLQPLFAAQPVANLADMVDAIRIGGDEPPDPFRWFLVECDPAVADAVLAALQALPLVTLASLRLPGLPATVSYGTNPGSDRTIQIQAAPNGVDAIHAWRVAGGSGGFARLADVENGWNTNHEELLTARIHSPSGFVADRVPGGGHGTGVAGILVGADNGVGTVGIVPDAELTLIVDDSVIVEVPTQQAADAIQAIATAARITAAAQALGAGGVLLIESAVNFFARPATPNGDPDLRPDILVEFQPAIQTAIRLATRAGVTVIEPAGNGGVDLDAFPFLAHTRPGAPTFSGAVVVGAGELVTSGPVDSWRRTFSSFGSRVDCFAAGSLIRAPSSAGPDVYLSFSGTSGASAIVAGAAAAIQSMSVAAIGAPLPPADVRRRLSDATLGTQIPPGVNGGIGAMPDLRKIARALGFARTLPVGAASTADDAMVIAFLDDDEHLVRRHWFGGAWGAPLPLPPPNDQFELTPDQPAVTSSEEHDPVDRLVHDAYIMGPLGIHHYFWDSVNQSGDLTKALQPFSVSPGQVAAQGRSLAAVRTAVNQLVIVAISPQGRLVSMTGDPDVLGSGISDPFTLPTVGSFRRTAGPVAVSRGPGLVDVVAIEDGGGLIWISGTVLATIGTGFLPGPPEPSATEFVPGGRPALIVVGGTLLAAAVGAEGFLRAITIDPVARTIDMPAVVDVQATIDTDGPLALAVLGAQVVVLGVDTEGVLRTATRPVAGSTWTSLKVVLSPQPLSALGGVAAVAMAASGLMAIVVGKDGTVMSSLSKDGTTWPELAPLD